MIVFFLNKLNQNPKMIALKTIRTALVWLCIHPDFDSTTPKWKKYLRICIAIEIQLQQYMFVIGGVRYFCAKFDNDIENAMLSLSPIIFGCCLIYDSVIAYANRKDIMATFNKFQAIYDECKFFFFKFSI